MALTSVYYDGPVTETSRAQNLAGSPEYGVYGPGDFKVTAHPSIPYAVLVEAGRAHGHGVTDTAAIDQVVQCATLASGTRWDLITVRRNWQPALGGPSELVALQAGTTAEIPTSRKVGPGVEDDQPLALVRWTGGLSAPAEIIDLRVWAGNGGAVAKHDLVRSYLNTPGTRLLIEGVEWVRRVGTNDIPEWVRKNPPAVDAGQGSSVPAIKAETRVFPVTNSNGDSIYTFPVAFPTALTSVVVTDAQSTGGFGVINVKVINELTDKTRVCLRFLNPNGTALAGLTLKVSYIAIGY